ncbi:Zinc/iron permease [Entophlyctis helioformis]|nr:Zinc/iron permease [Entophlyctis helioformis]
MMLGSCSAGRCPSLTILHNDMQTGKVVLAHMKLFGAGVILSTALVHMYAHASEALSNPCLPPPFTSYGSFAAVFLVAGIFMTHFVQVAASSHSPPHTDAEIQPILGQPGRHEQAPGIDSDPGCNTDDTSMESDALEQDDETKHNHLHGGLILHSPNTPVLLILLEFGIAMHSIIIGLTLGLARGSQLHSLLFAITVHQFFEGLALSAIVLSSPSSSASSSSASASLTTPVVSISTSTLLIVALYTLSTPAGITAGILLHSTFEQYATTVILLTGVLDALGAGILLYDSLANIIVPHFTSEAFKNDVWSNKGGQLLSMYGGSAVMAVIGHWA